MRIPPCNFPSAESSLSSLQRFLSPATERKYQQFLLQSRYYSQVLAATMAVVALVTAPGDLTAGLAAVCVAAGWCTGREELTVAGCFAAAKGGLFAENSLISAAGLCAIGLLANWHSLLLVASILEATSAATNMKSQLAVYFPVLVAGFLAESRRRTLWSRYEVATARRSQYLQLVNSQPSSLFLSDFYGKVVFRTAKKTQFSSLFQDDCTPLLSNFTELTRKLQEGKSQPLCLPCGLRIEAKRLPWCGRNCVLVEATDVRDRVDTVKALERVDMKTLSELLILERDANRRYRDMSDLSAQQELRRLHTLLHHVNALLAYERTLIAAYEPSNCTFGLRTELIDTVELANAVAETKALVISLIFEPGVPTSVYGDRIAVISLFRCVYLRVQDESLRGQSVVIRVRVATATDVGIKISVGVDATVENTATVGSDLRDASKSASKDVELSSFFTFLSSVSGVYSYSESEVATDRKRVSLRYDFQLRSDSTRELRACPYSSPIRKSVSADKSVWDFTAREVGKGSEPVRRRYVKRGEKTTNRAVKPIETARGMLHPIAETYSSEQLGEERAAFEAQMRLDVDGAEVPSETPSLLCRRLHHNHNDLRKLSSSSTTSPSSSPFNSSLHDAS